MRTIRAQYQRHNIEKDHKPKSILVYFSQTSEGATESCSNNNYIRPMAVLSATHRLRGAHQKRKPQQVKLNQPEWSSGGRAGRGKAGWAGGARRQPALVQS